MDGAIVVALAALVYLAAPRRNLNRFLAVLLFLEGSAFVYAVGLESLWLAAPQANFPLLVAQHGLNIAAWMVAGSALYLVFLAEALDTPLVAPFRTRGGRVMLGAVALGVIAYVLAHPEAAWVPDARVGGVHGSLWTAADQGTALVSLFAIGASLSAWHRAPAGSERRRRARLFAAAFGVRDGVLVAFGAAEWLTGAGILNQSLAVWPVAIFVVAYLAFPGLLAYAVLRGQLFDLELKVKWTLRRGTLASVFVAAFLIASAVAEQYLQQYGILVGGLAVGLLLVAFRPLERAADRLAEAALPDVQDTAEYRLVRKRDVYRAAVEGVAADGAMSEKERDLLAVLQEQLDLRPTEARRIEREVLGPAA